MNKGRSQLLAIILTAAIAFAFGIGGGLAGFKLASGGAVKGFSAASSAQQSVVNIEPSSSDITTAEAIAAKVMPSVVGISTVSTKTVSGFGDFDFFFRGGGGGGYSYDATSVGTGVIVDKAGYILTNSHVINDGNTKSITVSLYDGFELEGTVLWNDPTLDLAVVKIEADGLTAAELGDSDSVNIGAYAAVIGNPLGLQFDRSISAGIISGLNRTISVGDGQGSGVTTMEGLMQTDATINHGNSGGPLLNSRGLVIGINTAKADDGEGMGFAIPINTAKPIVEQIKETGRFDRAYIGISGIGLEEQTQYNAAQLEEYFGTSSGIYVSKVAEGGGADRAGIKQGDIILSVNGEKVMSMNKINTLLVKLKVGDTVEISYMRDGEIMNCTVELSSAMIMK